MKTFYFIIILTISFSAFAEKSKLEKELFNCESKISGEACNNVAELYNKEIKAFKWNDDSKKNATLLQREINT